MMTVHEVSELTGVSIRTLQYYDRIGLLRPASYTDAGYRLYDSQTLAVLQQILLFRELEFPLKDIRRIIQSPSFDVAKAIEQQIGLLRLKKERLERLISLALDIQSEGGVGTMDFSAFDTSKMDTYKAKAKECWGETAEYREYERNAEGRPREEENALGKQMMQIFARIGAVRDGSPAAPQAQALIRELRDFISRNFYTCSDKVLLGLGQMYTAGGEMEDNIDRSGGKGTAAFAGEAIRIFCANRGKNGEAGE